MSPLELLAHVKEIEVSLGRHKTIANGPREIDLDILFYDDAIVAEPNLVVPHPRVAEREFVLRPLTECVRRRDGTDRPQPRAASHPPSTPALSRRASDDAAAVAAELAAADCAAAPAWRRDADARR